MKLTAKDILKHSFVITIDDGRLEWFKKVFKFHGLTPMPRKFMGTTLWYNSPQYNCYLSHRNAILKAKKLKWPFVCIFEDDAYPCNNVVEEIDKHLKELQNDCKVLALGNITLLDVRGELENFHRDFKIYGAHAYVVFKDAYDAYIQMLDKAQEGDGAFYSRMDEILPKNTFFMPKKNLFIQYTHSNGMNNMGGYVYLEPQRIASKDGKMYVPYDKSIPEDRVVDMGFPLVESITGEPKTFNFQKNKDDALVFATVNAGTNTFTNITLKSILKFHPNAKIFVIDVPRKPEDAFFHIDKDTESHTEVIKGIMWEELDLPTIHLDEVNGLTDEEKETISKKFHGAKDIEVLPCGDFQHPMNIQLAIEALQRNFILIDSDAPLMFPVNALYQDNVATVAEVESWNYVHLDRLRPLLHESTPRLRFSPYVQFMNVDMLKKNDIRYFDSSTLKDNLDFAGWFKNQGFDGKETLFFWTGSLFHRAVTRSGLPYKTTKTSWYVDHFGGATWQEKGDRHKRFIEKYAGLFKNQDELRGKLS